MYSGRRENQETRINGRVQGTCGLVYFHFQNLCTDGESNLSKYPYSDSLKNKNILYVWYLRDTRLKVKFSKRATAAHGERGRRNHFHHFPTLGACLVPSADRRFKHKDMNDSTSGSSASLYMYPLYQREPQRQVRAPCAPPP